MTSRVCASLARGLQQCRCMLTGAVQKPRLAQRPSIARTPASLGANNATVWFAAACRTPRSIHSFDWVNSEFTFRCLRVLCSRRAVNTVKLYRWILAVIPLDIQRMRCPPCHTFGNLITQRPVGSQIMQCRLLGSYPQSLVLVGTAAFGRSDSICCR